MKFLKFIGRLLRNNLSLKIIAVIFAVILWSYVIAETNPPRPKTIDNIPIKIVNMDDLKAKNLTVADNLAELTRGVRVNLEVRQKDIAMVNTDNVTATVDFSGINSKGKVTLKINGGTKYGAVLGTQPSTLALTVDDYIKKPIPVSCIVTGMADSALYVGEPSVTPNVIEIAGARQNVEKAASAVCTVDLTGQTKSISQSMDVTVLDENGRPLNSDVFFDNLPSAIVKVDILPKKTVNVDAAGSIENSGKLREGYEITSVDAQPSTLEIAGEKSALDAVSKVLLANMNVSGASQDMVFHVLPKAIEGIRFLSQAEVQVTVHISQIQDKKAFHDVPVEVYNQPAGSRAELSPAAVDVTIAGGVRDLETLQKGDLKLFVDVGGLQKGIYTLPVGVEAVDKIQQGNITLSVTEIKVTIK